MKINEIYNESYKSTIECMINNNMKVDMIITSPPYWNLRNYNGTNIIFGGNEICKHIWHTDNFCSICGAWKGQLGLEPNFRLFIDHLVEIFNSMKDILKDSGSLWVNLGDTYGGSGCGTMRDYEKAKEHMKSSKQVYTAPYSPTGSSSLRKTSYNKSLLGIPDRFKIAMIDSGWICRNDIIWHKPNAMPSSARDRFTVDYERFFFFTKISKGYYFKQQRVPHKQVSINRLKYGWKGNMCNGQLALGSLKSGKTNKMCHPDGRNMRTVWSINTKSYKNAHFAVYPIDLIETPIKACCPKNGIVYDPFMGSGTTAVAAKQLKRQFIGSEISQEYCEIANARLDKVNVKEGLGHIFG
jgi:site-specific DNA-methyltransferase (adenine-specific)